MQTASDSLEYSLKTPNASAMIFQHEPDQVVGAASVYFASEEEAIGVEYLLAEPVHDDIIDTLLDRNTCTFNVPKSYYLTEFSSKEPALTECGHGARQGSLTEEDKTRERFLDGLSNGCDENYCCISCEDYLLDIELEEETPTLNDVTKDISCIGDGYLEDQLADLDGRNYGTDVLKLSDASTSSDHDALPFDDVSTDKLLKVFRKMSGWKNQDMRDKNFNFPKCSPESSENEGDKVPPASYQNLLTASTAFPSVFNFRRMPRVQHVKRREHIRWSFYKCLSSAAGETQFDCPDKWNSKTEPALPVEDRLIRRKSMLHGQSWCCPIQGHLSEDHRVNRAVDSDIRPAEAQVDPSGSLLDQSSDSTSEDDWTIGTETHRCNRKRKRNCWSTPEVLKLVEGVSKYGVGRWHGIKSVYFGSSVHRSSTNLKDKWRNLVKASCRRSHKQRGVDAKPKRGQPSIPHHVLNRVRELAVIHPHSKLHRARVLPTVFVASSSGVESDNRCFSVKDLELKY